MSKLSRIPGSSSATVVPAPVAAPRHSVADDVQGLCTAAIVSALGMSILASGGLMSGGIAGVGLLLHHATGWNFGVVFILLNLPFYAFSLRWMGWAFTVKTFLAVGVTGVVADLIPMMVTVTDMSPLFASIFGGALLGLGILSFIRHHSSLGGVGIVVVHLQRSRGWSAGKLQLAFDGTLMLCALLVLPATQVAYSALGALVLNLVLVFNHRPGRYFGA